MEEVVSNVKSQQQKKNKVNEDQGHLLNGISWRDQFYLVTSEVMFYIRNRRRDGTSP